MVDPARNGAWPSAAAVLLTLLSACGGSGAEPVSPQSGRPSVPSYTSASPFACATLAAQALSARDMARLAVLVGDGERLAFTPFAFPRQSDVSLPAEQLASELREGNVREWGTLGESGDPLRLGFADYLARYTWDPGYAKLGPRPVGTATFAGPNAELEAVLAAIAALHPGAEVVEYQRPPSAPGAMDWRVLRIVCVPRPAPEKGFRLARLVHSEWTP